MKLPIAKTEEILIQTLDKETLIYDLKKNKSYCLNETSSVVYQHCDGETTFEELKRKTLYSDELIFLALDQLENENLLAAEKSFVNPVNKVNRREVIRKIGVGSMIALPLITGLIAPKASQAASAASSCSSGSCLANGCNLGWGPTGACAVSAPECCTGYAEGTRDPSTQLCTNHICKDNPFN